jgi:hypothetical protein
MARTARDAEARLIHFNEGGRYDVMAAYWDRPFLLAGNQWPPSEGEQSVLRRFN